MKNDLTVLLIKDYGKINLKLNEIIESRGLTRNAVASAAHTRFEVIDKWYDKRVIMLDLDVLARLCHVLNCSIDDILEYTPND